MQKIFTKEFKPGEKWSGCIGKGKYIHFKALGDDANVSILLYNMRDTSERYNMPDSTKAQYTYHLTAGNVLMSDNGRVLASIVQDSTGWNDTISGHTTRMMTDEKYGKTSYQKEGLFSKVYVEEDGSMHYVSDHCKYGDTVTLRTEMDIIFIASNTPNPLDPAKEYPSVPVTMEVYDAPPVDLLDPCVQSRTENYRAFENTWDYNNLLGI